MKNFPSLFITGTDTGVGKTFVGSALAGFLKRQGIDVGVFKPCESGCLRDEQGHLIPEDALSLKNSSGTKDSLDEISLFRYATPVAPGLAAEIEQKPILIDKIEKQYQILKSRHSLMLVEGAGGLQVPLTTQETVTDLIEKLKLPVLLVARNALGTVNHTLLSLEFLKSRNIPVWGVLLNDGATPADASSKDNLKLIQQHSPTKLNLVVVFPRLEKHSLSLEIEKLFSSFN